MTYMSTIDVLLLKILAKKSCDKNIKEIQNELRLVNVSLCRKGIHQRLERLKSHQLIIGEWKRKARVYAISEAGKFKLAIFQEQLKA